MGIGNLNNTENLKKGGAIEPERETIVNCLSCGREVRTTPVIFGNGLVGQCPECKKPAINIPYTPENTPEKK